MRRQDELRYSRAKVKSRFAVLPQEGVPVSRHPAWPGAIVHVLASPAMGAAFVEYRILLEPGMRGQQAADQRIEHFIYIVQGRGTLTLAGDSHELTTGGFSLIPPHTDYEFVAREETAILLLRKAYEPLPQVKPFAPLVGNQEHVASESFLGDPGARLQLLIPDEWQYDMAMNIFTFDVGHSLPFVETHVMEHGLYFLQGQGLYYLDETWMEVEATDFIWMGPFCPQCYYATGPIASKYIYYKNINREIPLA